MRQTVLARPNETCSGRATRKVVGIDSPTEAGDDGCDLAEYATLRLIVNGGWKVDDTIPVTVLRQRFDAMHFAQRSFFEVIDSLIAKGLLGGDKKFIYLTISGASCAQR
jgi:hypothetical protein